MPEATVRLTREQIEFYHREGYLAIESISTPDELAWMRESYDRIFTQRAGREQGNQFDLAGADEEGKEAALPQILGYERYAPEFGDSLMLANAKAITAQLLGAKATAGSAHAIYKPPKFGAETPWHQDEAYWAPQMDYQSLSIWVPLQEATPENGCMHFVPRSHRMPIRKHQSINNDPRVHGLELHPSEMHWVQNVVACPLPAGGCTVHDSRTMHFTPANKSDIPRRACIMGGALKATPRKTPRRFPWNEEKRTARTERAKAFAEKDATAEDKGEKQF